MFVDGRAVNVEAVLDLYDKSGKTNNEEEENNGLSRFFKSAGYQLNAFAEWKPSRIGDDPAPLSWKMPTRVGFFDAIDDIDSADDSAKLEVLRNVYSVFVFYTTQVGLERCLGRARVNEQRHE